MFELSENECAEIVRKATRHKNVVKIVDFSIDGFGNYLGFLGEYFRLKIDSNLDESHCELNFFVKTLPMRDLKQRKMLVETGIFSKEVKIYEKLLLDLSEISNDKRFWCPRAYYFRDDLLVLDDLSLKGFKMLPSHINFDRAHVEETLKTLSIYHTASIVYEENQTKSIPDEFGDLLFETSVDDRDWFHAGLRTIYDIALQRTRFGKSHHDLLQKDFYQKIFEVINIMQSSPFDVLKVLAHRDVWRNNLMFKYEDDDCAKPTHCVLLDFQTVRYLPITIDVLMAIVCTTRTSHQDEHFDSYVRFYYEHLSMELKMFNINLSTKMSFESFTKSCDYHKTFALVYNVIVVMLTMIPREFFIDFGEDNFRDFADGNRSKFILELMTKDSYYEECLVEAVEAVVKFIYKLP